MKNMMKVLTATVVCVLGMNMAHAAPAKKMTSTKSTMSKTSKTTAKANRSAMGGETQQQTRVCANKSQGAMVSYTYGGTLFNGTCQMGENGRLQFMPPMPTGEAAQAVQETM